VCVCACACFFLFLFCSFVCLFVVFVVVFFDELVKFESAGSVSFVASFFVFFSFVKLLFSLRDWLIVDNNREKGKRTSKMGEVLTEQEKLGVRNEQTVKPLVFAYYVTGHGLGHATRVIEVARHLCGAGHEVHIVTVAPEFVFRRDIPSPKLHIRKVLLDCGAVQSDALTVDCLGSLEQV
jgi:hypothetical protein